MSCTAETLAESLQLAHGLLVFLVLELLPGQLVSVFLSLRPRSWDNRHTTLYFLQKHETSINFVRQHDIYGVKNSSELVNKNMKLVIKVGTVSQFSLNRKY